MASEEVKTAARLSLRCYDDTPIRHSITVGNAHAIVVVTETAIYVAVRGTDDAMDVIENRNFGPAVYSSNICESMFIHAGFSSHAWKLADAVAECIKPFEGTLPVIFCGHSLGGAAAMLLPLYTHIEPNRIITFGAPRVLRSETDENYPYAHLVTRFVRPLDLVPDVPLRIGNWLTTRYGGWSHVGQCRWLLDDGTIELDPPAWWQYARRLRRAWEFSPIRNSPACISLKARAWHSMQAYCDLLCKGSL